MLTEKRQENGESVHKKPKYMSGPFRCLGSGKYATPEGKEMYEKIKEEQRVAREKDPEPEPEEVHNEHGVKYGKESDFY
jgi:hypothetical protein